LIEDECITVTAGVPTLYNNLLKYLEEQGHGAGTLKRIAVARICARATHDRGFRAARRFRSTTSGG
jgi:hypothetical protein